MNKKLKKQIEDILTMITEDDKKESLSNFFTKEIEVYIQKIKKIEKDMTNKAISLGDAFLLFDNYTNSIIKKAEIIENKINDRIILKRIKEIFRNQINYIINKSFLMRMSYKKPYGYPGDYKIIEIFYKNTPLSKGIGYCGDKYILQNNYVKAVRIRKDMMKKEIKLFLKKAKSKCLNIMNVGSGSCREIREIFCSPPVLNDKEVTFTFIDKEKRALEFAKKSLNKYQKNSNIKFKFIRENVFNLYKYPQKYMNAFGRQDLIYCIGLADYIPDIILGEIIKFCFNLLNKNGRLIIAHKNVKVHKSTGSDWFCNWYFYPRNEKDVNKIINEYLKGYKFILKTVEDKTRHLFFIYTAKT